MRRYATVCCFSLALFAVIAVSAPARAAELMPARVQTTSGTLVLATSAWQRDIGASAVEVGLYSGTRLAQRSDFAAAPGAKRLRLVPLRTLTADQIGRMLVRDMASAGTKAEAASHVGSLVALGQAFALVSKPLVAGDSLVIEYLPGQGVRALINDAPVSAFLGDAQFFALLSRAWVGEAADDRAALKVAQR